MSWHKINFTTLNCIGVFKCSYNEGGDSGCDKDVWFESCNAHAQTNMSRWCCMKGWLLEVSTLILCEAFGVVERGTCFNLLLGCGGALLMLSIVRVSALTDQQVDPSVCFNDVAQVTCYSGLFVSSKSYFVVIIMCTHLRERRSSNRRLLCMHWCNHKFALEPHG